MSEEDLEHFPKGSRPHLRPEDFCPICEHLHHREDCPLVDWTEDQLERVAQEVPTDCCDSSPGNAYDVATLVYVVEGVLIEQGRLPDPTHPPTV